MGLLRAPKSTATYLAAEWPVAFCGFLFEGLRLKINNPKP